MSIQCVWFPKIPKYCVNTEIGNIADRISLRLCIKKLVKIKFNDQNLFKGKHYFRLIALNKQSPVKLTLDFV